jgi:hypothetical protein
VLLAHCDSGFHADRPPRNKGLRYPADPPTVEEVVAVMRIAEIIETVHARRAPMIPVSASPGS